MASHLKDQRSQNKSKSIVKALLPSEQHVRLALKNLMRLPVFLIQVGGYYPYSLTADNELKFSFFHFINCISILVAHFATTFIYFQFYNKVEESLEDYSTTEKYSSLIFGAFCLFGQVSIRTTLLRNHSTYINYHSSVTKLIVELILQENVGPGKRREDCSFLYFGWIKACGWRLRRVCLLTIVCIISMIIILVIPVAFFQPVQILLESGMAFTIWVVSLDFAIGMLIFNAVTIFLCSYIAILGVAFQIIHYKSHQSCTGLQLRFLFERIDKLESLVDEFNRISEVFFVIWFVFILVLTVQQIFTCCVRLQVESYYVILSVIPSIINGLACLILTCNVSEELEIQVRIL